MKHLGVLLALLAALAAEAQPVLRLTPDTLRFGQIPQDATMSGQFVLIESIGDEPITIKIHTAFRPFFMPFENRYVLDEVQEDLIPSRAAVLQLAPFRDGAFESELAVDTDERGAYRIQAFGEAVDPVAFTLAPGETASRTLEIRNPGFARLDARTEAEAPWLGVSPAAFSLAPDDGTPVTVSVDARGLAPGVYRDTLRASDDDSVLDFSWRVPVSLTVTASTAEAPDPDAAQPILTVSPTPARGAVRLSFALDTTASVTLRVYDARGREVARLVDGRRREGTVEWQAPSPGLYLARLVTPEGAMTRRLVVTR
ncbi:MAG: T9SS type A sorting domain-containing protein [Bacteroidota bacterium]